MQQQIMAFLLGSALTATVFGLILKPTDDCTAEINRLDAGWESEAHAYDQCNRERILCRKAIEAGHRDGYEEPLLLDSDAEPSQLCWYEYCWDYEPIAY